MEIFIYTYELTHHICDLLEELGGQSVVSSVKIITDVQLSPERQKLGWNSAIKGAYGHLNGLKNSEIHELVAASRADSVHIFVGMRHLECVRAGIAACIERDRRIAIMHETRTVEGLGGFLRYWQSWLTEGRLCKRAIVLAIGALGETWFLRTGYRPSKVYPFAYFIKPRAAAMPAAARETGPVQLGYIGRLDPDKGLDDLLESLQHIRSDWRLMIAGHGPQAEACARLAQSDNRVRFMGVLPMEKVQQHMLELDILIQPSRTSKDGWAAVVSEALINGVAVITTDKVGASMCLKEEWRGLVVGVRDPLAIAKAIDRLNVPHILNEDTRRRRSAWGLTHLTAATGAKYLVDILANAYDNAPRPPSFVDG